MQASGVGSRGSVSEREGDYKAAIEHFTKDLVICQELGDRQGIAVVEGLIGDLNSVMGDFTYAIQHLDRSLSISRELGSVRAWPRQSIPLGIFITSRSSMIFPLCIMPRR